MDLVVPNNAKISPGAHTRSPQYSPHMAKQQATEDGKVDNQSLQDSATRKPLLNKQSPPEPFTPEAVYNRFRGRAVISRRLRPPHVLFRSSPSAQPKTEMPEPTQCTLSHSTLSLNLADGLQDSPFRPTDKIRNGDSPSSWRFASGINTTIGTGAVYPAGSQQHSALIKNSMQPDMDCMTDLNIGAVAEMLATDDSLTFSTSEESRLYEWMPVDRGHSGMEHTLNGTVLFRSPEEKEEHERAVLSMSQDTSLSSVLADLPIDIASDPFYVLHPWSYHTFTSCRL